jgi:cobalt-zinc-cadmium efflux system outer membrane protein
MATDEGAGMFRSRPRHSWLIAALLAGLSAPGCVTHPEEVRQALTGPLGRPSDIQAVASIGPAGTPRPGPETASPPGVEELPAPREQKKDWFRIPPVLPGAAEAEAPLKLPPLPLKGQATPEQIKAREEAVRKLYPNLIPLGPEVQAAPGPGGKALTLAELQQIAAENSPTLRRAMADVKAARGAMIQAGAYPNPTVSYQATSEGTSGGPTVGGGVQQTIKTWGKLKLAQAAAEMDLRNAELALRAAQNDLTTAVRSGYFSVLVAQEGVLISRALAQLTDEAYLFQRQIVLASGEAGPYEPLQVYVQAEQARAALVQARNRYVSAWKQLAATLNRPEMEPALLAGRADAAVPRFEYDKALQRVLANHTDVRTAEVAAQKARYSLRLQEVTPVPDLVVGGTLINDLTPPGPATVVASVNVGMTVPLWDQNQGAVLQARGQLAHAVEDVQRVRNDLTTRLADAFERYQTNRDLVTRYRETILANQLRVYRAVRARYHLEPEKIAFADIFTTQQAVATVLQGYLTALQAQWTAVVDVANLLQTDDLYLYGQDNCGEPGPPLPRLLDRLVPPAGASPAAPRKALLLPPAADLSAPPAVRLEEPRTLPPARPLTNVEAVLSESVPGAAARP